MGLQIMNYECPTCGAVKCSEHCNNCGISIHGKTDPYNDDKWTWYEAGTEIEHRCMQNGTRTGRWLHVNDKEPNEYQLNKHCTIYRLGNSSNWKCTLCNRVDDLPHMEKHHELDGWPCLRKQWALEFKESKPTTIDTKNQRMDAFLKKIESVWTI